MESHKVVWLSDIEPCLERSPVPEVECGIGCNRMDFEMRSGFEERDGN
jgi:hypothetical protein